MTLGQHCSRVCQRAGFKNPLRHRYLRCGAVVARLSVNFATLIWSVVVLLRRDALVTVSYGPTITEWATENTFGWFFLSISLASLYRIFRQSKPHPIGVVGYSILFFAWGFVLSMLIYGALLERIPVQPTAISCVTVIFSLAAYSLAANPKARDDSGV